METMADCRVSHRLAWGNFGKDCTFLKFDWPTVRCITRKQNAAPGLTRDSVTSDSASYKGFFMGVGRAALDTPGV